VTDKKKKKSKFKKIKIISNIFSDHKGTKLKKKQLKEEDWEKTKQNTKRPNNMLLNNQWFNK